MPGLYRNQTKRKRVTLNSSCTNDESVWHSTPVDYADVGSTGVEETEGLSPVKRLAFGNGVGGRRINTPGAGPGAIIEERMINTPAAASVDGINTPEGGIWNDSPTPGPSSNSIIRTPAAAAHLVMESMDIPEEEVCEEEDLIVRQRDLNAGDGDAVENTKSQSGGNVHNSKRFGPVVIHPPSGHSFFSSVLQQNGFLLTLPKNHLCHDVILFRNKMTKWILESTKENSRIEDNATKFTKAMKKYFATKENLSHACTTTLNDQECYQPSLLACLLGVSSLQKPLLEVVLPALSEASFSTSQEEIDLVNTIVSQMKWLPVLVDGSAFAEDLLNILDAASIPAKKHIIRLLPEVFLPEYHLQLVPKLMEIFDVGSQVNVTMLDCFSALAIPEDECLRIHRAAVDQMSTASLGDLPAYMSFLFRCDNTVAQLNEGITEMREKLEIKPKRFIPKEDAYQIEILERIRFFAAVNPALPKIWTKQIKDDLSNDVELHAIDLLMLIVFLERDDRAATSTLTALLSKPHLLNPLFDNLMRYNNQMLHLLFSTIARFLDAVLREKSSKCHDSAAATTKKLFVGLGPVLSQHLTQNLISILVNGHQSCRDVVLQIFTSIAETDAKKLLYFHTYLMGALVYVIKYPPRQMQSLMNILAILAYMPENLLGDENAFTAEFMILLRKQITHTNSRTRCFGVLGIIAAIKQLAANSDNEERIDSLLALVYSSIENDEEACSIFFDEIIPCISLLPKNVCIKFKKIINFQFQRIWTVSQSSDSVLLKTGKGQGGLQLEPAFDANKELEGDQMIVVLEPRPLQMSPLVVPSLFRVMAELERASTANGELDDIDAVLGSPLLFPKFSIYYDLPSLEEFEYDQKFYLGRYLVISINYFRECVSAFVGSEIPELRVKLWLRLSNIITLQKCFVKHFDALPNLPLAYGSGMNMDDNSGPGSSGALVEQDRKTAAKQKKKPKAKTVKKTSSKKKVKRGQDGEDEESETSSEEVEEDNRPTTEKRHINNLLEQIQPKSCHPYIRKLDSRVFSLLKYPFKPDAEPVDFSHILSNLSTSTQSVNEMRRIEMFNPETLIFLLAEIKNQSLEKKCNFKLLSVDNLLVNICNHIESVSMYYSNQAGNSRSKDRCSADVAACLRLLINIMDLYLEAIMKHDKAKQSELWDGVINQLASKYTSDVEGEEDGVAALSQEEHMSKISKYLSNFSTFIIHCDPQTAQDHVKLMKTLHDLASNPRGMKQAIEDTIKAYLGRNWKLPASSITYFIKTWLAVTSSPLTVIRDLVNELILEVEDSDDIPNTSVYKACNKNNFHTWYSAIFEGLSHYMFKFGRRRGDFADSIKLWTKGNDILDALVQVSQKLRKPLILNPLIKFSRIYLEAFISGGVVLMPELWKQNFNQGQKFTKTLQSSTRKIQNICEYSKILKDNFLLRHVPHMKKTLETLIFKVREVVGGKGIVTALWIGELKLRDLDGEEIDSQPFQVEPNEESALNDEDEEEMQVDEENEEEQEDDLDSENSD